MKLTSFIAACAVLAADVNAFFNVNGIESLSSANWAQMIDGDQDNAWVVTFYADWCPHCQAFSLEFPAVLNDPKLADKKLKFGAVDVMANRDLLTKWGVTKAPTVKVFGTDKAAPVDYLGEKIAANFVTFLEEFAVKNDFVRKPEFPDAAYTYNLNEIFRQIYAAHQARIAASNRDYTTRLQALRTQRVFAPEEAKASLDLDIEAARQAQATLLNNWDNQVVDLMNSLIVKNQDNRELSVYIESLKLNWLNIVWNSKTRKIKRTYATTSLTSATSSRLSQISASLY